MHPIYIAHALRTVHGRFLGKLAGCSAKILAVAAGEKLLAGRDPAAIDQVILGNVLAAGLGMNLARQVALDLHIPQERPAFTVNMMCASGLQAVLLAHQAIAAGQADVVLCGGSESMSNAPFLQERKSADGRLGDKKLVDVILRDGLLDAQGGEHMAISAQRLSQQMDITRAEQDAFALASHQKAAAAFDQGRLQGELVPVADLNQDENIRRDSTLEKLAGLKPAFGPPATSLKPQAASLPSITAGNASTLNDGAGLLLVCNDVGLKRLDITNPLARILAGVAVGCDPQLMGLGPVYAIKALLARPHDGQRLTLQDFDSIEINEAFAAQVLACVRKLGLSAQQREQLNPDGGAIAIGHPLAASGARITTHAAHRIAAGLDQRNLASLCVGGGMGAAIMLQKVQ